MIKKILAGSVTAIALAALVLTTLYGFNGTAAHAQTTAYPYARNLSVGASGADVSALQTFLISKGYLTVPSGTGLGYFGSLTQSALIRYQLAKGIVPASGLFGPITRSVVTADSAAVIPPSNPANPTTPPTGCAPGYVYNTITGQLCNTPSNPSAPQASEGQLTHIQTVGGTDSSIDEDDTNSKVLIARLDAKDGDVTVSRAEVDFDLTNAINSGGSSNLSQYLSSVSLWLDGKKLATENVSAGSRSGKVTSFWFTNLNGVIDEGNSSRLSVAVNAASTIDSNNTGAAVTVSIPQNGIRTTTGNNVSETYPSSNANLTNSITFHKQDPGNITLSSDENSNKDATIQVDDRQMTDNVNLLNFTLRAKDQADTIDSITVHIDAAGTASTSQIVNTVYLYANGKEIGSESVDRNATAVTFDDLDFSIPEESTASFAVKTDINKETGNFAEGDSITAAIGSDDVSAEDNRGRGADINGSAQGGTITLRTEGISVTAAGSSEKVDSHSKQIEDDSTGEYSFTFKIQAFGNNAYIPLTAAEASSTDPAGAGVYYILQDSNGTETTAGTSTAVVARTSGGSTVTIGGMQYLKINDGQTATVKLQVSFDPDTNGFYRAELEAVNFNTSTAATPTSQERAAPQDSFQTSYVNIQ